MQHQIMREMMFFPLLLSLISFFGPSFASYDSAGYGAGGLSLDSIAKMQTSAVTNKEAFRSSSRNFVKPIIPFPSIVDMMSKSSTEFKASPIDPNIVEDNKLTVAPENLKFVSNSDDLKVTEADDAVHQLVDMIQDSKYSDEEEVLTANMIRLVEQPRRPELEMPKDGGKTAKKIRVPGKLIELLRSDIPITDKRKYLDQLTIRLKLNDVYDYPTLKIIEEGVSSDGIFDTTDEQIDLGQPRVPRAKTFPDLVLHPVGHFQLAQNRQDQTIQNTHNSLTPQETGSQEIIYDYSDLVYEYPEYDDNDDQNYLLDEAKEQDFSTIKIEKEPATNREDHSSRKPKKISSEQNTDSNSRLVLQKFHKSHLNTNRKSEQLKQPRNNEKKEVNNFGFPSSFGEAGVDFPMFDLHRMPSSSFQCDGLVNGGLYADVSAQCQMYHICVQQGTSGMVRHSFLCPNGTLFSQETLSCTTWHQVDCSVQGVDILSELIESWDQERNFIDSGEEVRDPLRDLPWRFRDREAV